MYDSSIGECKGCGTLIFRGSFTRYNPDETSTQIYLRADTAICKYCGEEYKRNEKTHGIERISTTPLPLTAELLKVNGTTETKYLRKIVRRFEKAECAFDKAQQEFKEACRQYEAARPRKQ